MVCRPRNTNLVAARSVTVTAHYDTIVCESSISGEPGSGPFPLCAAYYHDGVVCIVYSIVSAGHFHPGHLLREGTLYVVHSAVPYGAADTASC